jgi:hypothetical protein
LFQSLRPSLRFAKGGKTAVPSGDSSRGLPHWQVPLAPALSSERTKSFKPAAEPTVATDHPAPEDIAAEIQFREDLWRAYRLEAINAGLSIAQATGYASALSQEMSLAVGASERAPVWRNWFYQSRIRAVERTITSGLIELRHWESSKAISRAGAAGT